MEIIFFYRYSLVLRYLKTIFTKKNNIRTIHSSYKYLLNIVNRLAQYIM